MKFLSTPSARRATGDASGVQRAPVISIHALREEGDQQAAPVVSTADKFLSTPSARRATIPSRQGLQGQGISIHALREEGDAAVNDLLQRHNISIHALREEGDPFRHRSERVKEDFYPRPPRGGRRDAQGAVDLDAVFLSTPSARRATHSPQCGSGCKRYFYPRPPRGGRPSPLAPRSTLTRFLSTPSARRATLAACAALHADAISIHALREEGDTVPSSETTSVEDFYPRPPRGGRLQPVFQGKNCCLNFYPRPPRGGRPINLGSGAMRGDFYPRPPRGGRRRAENVVTADTLFLSTPSARRATHPRFCCSGESGISIHALREEGDVCGSPHAGHHKGFLSTPSARRATKVGGHGLQVRRISIHALREEGDLSRMAQNLQQVKFLSTPSARRATHQRISDGAGAAISIHALREEGDLSHPPFATF